MTSASPKKSSLGDGERRAEHLAAAASPALAGTINTELARYNNLQDFVGLTFDEWATAIGALPPTVIHMPVVRR